MKNKIIEIITEPSKIYVGSTFLLKVKVEDMSPSRKYLATESFQKILSEDNKRIIAEWGEKIGK